MNTWVLVFLIFNGNNVQQYRQEVAIAPDRATCEAKVIELNTSTPKEYPNATAVGCIQIRLANGKEI